MASVDLMTLEEGKHFDINEGFFRALLIPHFEIEIDTGASKNTLNNHKTCMTIKRFRVSTFSPEKFPKNNFQSRCVPMRASSAKLI